MPILPSRIKDIPLPHLQRVQQSFDDTRLADITNHVVREVRGAISRANLKPGGTIAFGVGSRGIANLREIVIAAVDTARKEGMHPSILAAMGSHGGGTAEGQRAVLAGLDITERRVGAPVVCSMEVERIGATTRGVPVYFDSAALGFDAIVPINRIKPHTDYTGPVESGLCKMLAIGFGNHEGCSRLHQEGFSAFASLIPEVASVIVRYAPIVFGLAVVENAYDRTRLVEAVDVADIPKREPELLQAAYRNMPGLPFDASTTIDVLIVDEIGKEISGAGMDPNIVGRTTAGILHGYKGPKIKRIVVLGITAVSKGNAVGIGLADFTTESLVATIDRESMFANAIASGNPESGRIPIAFIDPDDAVRAALMTAGVDDWSTAKIVRIRNTLDLEEILVSQLCLPAIRGARKSSGL